MNRYVMSATLIGIMGLAPMFASPYYIMLLLGTMAYAIALLGLNLLFGYGGLMPLGHAMYMAIGAYASAVLGTKLNIQSFELQLLVATTSCIAISALVGTLCVRYSAIYFSILTLSIGMILHSFLFKFYDLTGGESGISVKRPTLFGQAYADLDKTQFLAGPFFYYALVLFAVATLVMWVVVRSPFGLAVQATRDNVVKVEYLGLSASRIKLMAYVLSALYAGVAGTVVAVVTGAADPELAYWTQSGNLVFMAILGGLARFWGPLVGAAGFTVMQDTLMASTQYWRLALGVALAFLVIVAPQGLLGIASRIWRRRNPS